jgi:hypothetical protein
MSHNGNNCNEKRRFALAKSGPHRRFFGRIGAVSPAAREQINPKAMKLGDDPSAR